MPLLDRLGAAFSAPAGRVVEGSVRAIVAELLQERGYASPAEVLALREELAELRARMQRLEAQVDGLRARVEALEAVPVETGRAREAPEASPSDPAPAEASPSDPESADPAPGALATAGWSRSEQDRWRAAGRAGRIGPEGYLELDGRAVVVDAALEGRPYDREGLEAGAIRVDGRILQPVPLPLAIPSPLATRDGGPRAG